MNNYFVYVGNAYPHKNLDRLVKAIVLLNKNKEKAVILKISSSRNIFTERLEKLIAKYNAQKYVKLLGYVPDEKISELYRKSVAFVFPTLSEGFGLPPMEAINAGTLVVQSDIPVLKEVYAESTIYFNPMDVNSIVDSLDSLLTIDGRERKNKIMFAQNFIKKYSWLKMAKETLKVYKKSI